jgi:hypothetical protein
MITNDRRSWLISCLDEALSNPDYSLVEIAECLFGMEADSEVSDLMSFLQAATRATREQDSGRRLRAIETMRDRLRSDPRAT